MNNMHINHPIRENPKLRLARLRREAEGRSPSASNSPSSSAYTSHASAPTGSLSRAGSEQLISIHGKEEHERQKQIARKLQESFADIHCANSARIRREAGGRQRRSVMGAGETVDEV
jgi:hypothetical protein